MRLILFGAFSYSSKAENRPDKLSLAHLFTVVMTQKNTLQTTNFVIPNRNRVHGHHNIALSYLRPR